MSIILIVEHCVFYKRELWASQSAGAHSTKSLKINGCKRWCPKDLRVHAPAAPVLTHSLAADINLKISHKFYWNWGWKRHSQKTQFWSKFLPLHVIYVLARRSRQSFDMHYVRLPLHLHTSYTIWNTRACGKSKNLGGDINLHLIIQTNLIKDKILSKLGEDQSQ